MSITLLPVGEITDVARVMRELTPVLVGPENYDIEVEFEGTIAELGTHHNTTAEYLGGVAARCVPGRHEVFAVCLGDMAIGMGWMTNIRAKHPHSVTKDSPNLSGFIAYPWRNQGYGTESLRARLQIVDERFGGHAWTYVAQSNQASKTAVMKAGLVTSHDPTVPAGSDLFLYNKIQALKK